MADVPEFKPSLESSSNWINIIIAAVSGLAGIPALQKMLGGLAGEDTTLYGTAINCTGIFVFGWIVVTVIKVIGNRASNVESAYLQAHAAATPVVMATPAIAPTTLQPPAPPPAA